MFFNDSKKRIEGQPGRQGEAGTQYLALQEVINLSSILIMTFARELWVFSTPWE